MKESTTLFTLGEDVLYLILKQVHLEFPSSLRQFAICSKECEKHAGPILYCSITLSDKGDEKALSQTKALVERLLKENDSIHDYVREIAIADWGNEIDHSRPPLTSDQALGNSPWPTAPWDSSLPRNGESKLISCSQLSSIIGNVRNLESFKWDAKSMIPAEVISMLEKCSSAAKLFVTNNRRFEKTADKAMDIRLLSSPLLYSLNYSIFYGNTGSSIVSSEFRRLKEILAECRNLELLSLATYTQTGSDVVPITSFDSHTDLPVGPGDALTKLHTLTIPISYMPSGPSITKVHSAMFNQLNDLTCLKRLDLRNLCISYAFEPLMGRVQNVKHLEIFFAIQNPVRRSYGQKRCKDARLIRDFILSIDSLQTLKITSDEDNFEILWDAILKHSNSLQTLFIHTLPDQTYHRKAPPALTCDRIEQLQKCKISDLAVDLLIPDIAWFSTADHGHNDHDLDPSIALALANFTNVERLKIFVELPTESSVFSKEYIYDPVDAVVPVPPLEVKAAKEVALGIFQQIFVSESKAALRELEICFCRLRIGDRMDSWVVHNSVWVRKMDINFINKPTVPGYVIEVQEEWKH